MSFLALFTNTEASLPDSFILSFLISHTSSLITGPLEPYAQQWLRFTSNIFYSSSQEIVTVCHAGLWASGYSRASKTNVVPILWDYLTLVKGANLAVPQLLQL